ncbi:ABC transporter permease, partial [Bacteroidota bacterium]
YNRKNVAVIELPDEMQTKRETIQINFLNHPAVVNVSASQNIPGLWSSKKIAKIPSMVNEDALNIRAYGISYNFPEVFEMKLIAGRYFNQKYTDKNNILINETAAEKFGLENPIGEKISIDDKEYTIVGVTADFVFNDIGFDVDPAVLWLSEDNMNYMLVKLNTPYANQIQTDIQNIWKSVLPNVPFKSFDMDKHFTEMMSLGGSFISIIKLIGYFAVMFSYIGLIGLISFLISRRTKEIGIRKVLGASITSIIKNIVREFLFLVAIANIIALTVSYYLWGKIIQTGLLYMQPFDLQLTILIIILTILVAVIFILSKTYKTAVTNPSESLRYE